MTDAIEVRRLTKQYGDVHALDGVDFTVPEATVFGLLGPNGAGKTTTVRILATVLEPTSGTARVLGFDVARDPYAVRCRIGLAGQYAAVDENLTGRENLKLIGQLAQLRRPVVNARADELLDRFELSHAANRPAKTYSGGMRRRLDVAAALVQRPPVLFLDEPTTGLDLPSRNALWEMIRELVADGTTVLLTTQYLEEADQLADRIAVVDDGRVIANDTPAMLKAQLGSTVLELAYGDEQQAHAAIAALSPSYAEHIERVRSTVKVTTTDSVRDMTAILHVLDIDNLSPDSLIVREPSLDDVFLAITGRAGEAVPSEAVQDPEATGCGA